MTEQALAIVVFGVSLLASGAAGFVLEKCFGAGRPGSFWFGATGFLVGALTVALLW